MIEESKLYDEMCNHVGRKFPIPRKSLWQKFDIKTQSDDRHMRQMIHDLKNKPYPVGLPILYATTKPMGYYLPENQVELDEGRNLLRSRIKDECVTLARLKTYGSWFVAGDRQRVMKI